MPYGEVEAKSLGHGKELISEPCYKKLKSTEGAFVFPHHGSSNFHKVHEKTGNDWVVADVRGHSYQQEDKTKIKTTDLLKPVHEEIPGNRPDVTGSIDSQVLQAASRQLVSTDDEIYSTSKAFIGPIYKPPEKRKCTERRNQVGTISGVGGKGGKEEKQKSNSTKSEIDNELFQFYKEIEELENEKDDLEGSCKDPEPPEEQFIPYFDDHNNDLIKYEEEKKRDLSNALQSHRDYQWHVENEPGRHPRSGQVIPSFCDELFTSFRPEWQPLHSFIVPRGPPLPSSNYHLNIQRFNAPPSPLSNIFHAQDGSQIRNGCYVNSYVPWNCLTFDQNNDYIDCSEIISSDHPYRNGCSVQGGYVSNGFCETSEGCWKGPSMDKYNRTDSFMNQQFQEEKLKLQKLLILLRGLPGSGKTTLSRVLLGQSRDGIVFSTDDYFLHQDGYRYNVNQLGDAHDWNQNRAKQAINQGRSPVIIDNTNTQAWEMKPYVEMAIGKGYRVEFHEPETWWKFDPEELEKRNKHGVSRKKIAQMLDRYEYQMSISIVMNSVEPGHRSTLRPPLEGTQRERDSKNTGPRLGKTKQKRNRKRKKKRNSPREIMGEDSCETSSYQEPPWSEGGDMGEAKRDAACAVADGLGSDPGGAGDSPKDGRWENVNPEDRSPNVMSVAESDSTPQNYLCAVDDDVFRSLLLRPNDGSVTCPAVARNLPCVAGDDCPGTREEKPMGSRHAAVLDAQDRFAETPRAFTQERETVGKSPPNGTILRRQRGSGTPDQVFRKERGVNTTKNNWAFFFSNHLPDQESQLGSERQPYFGGWPEAPHEFLCEQRPKKDR